MHQVCCHFFLQSFAWLPGGPTKTVLKNGYWISIAGNTMKFSDFKLLIGRINKAAGNKRFGNRLAEGIIISYKSISAIVSADQYKLAFCLLQL